MLFIGEKLDQDGLLKVNEYLQVEGHDNIFALGDCTNADRMKLAFYVGKQVPIVYRNLAAHLSNKPLTKYKRGTCTRGKYPYIQYSVALHF